MKNAAPHFIDDIQLAEISGISTSTLRKWRLQGKGPEFKKFGSRVRYPIVAVEAWAGITIDRATLESSALQGEGSANENP